MTPTPATTPASAEIGQQLIQNLLVTSNLGQHIIMTTEDKIRLTINDHLRHMEQRNGWIAPLGILIPIIAAFVTADFKDSILTAPQWHAIFVVFGLLSVGWLVYAVIRALSAPSVQDFIEALSLKKD
jgi:hypothetical protein